MGDNIGKMLSAGGQGLLKGMENYGNGMGIPGSGLNMAGGPMSGIGIMEELFKRLGIGRREQKDSPTSEMSRSIASYRDPSQYSDGY